MADLRPPRSGLRVLETGAAAVVALVADLRVIGLVAGAIWLAGGAALLALEVAAAPAGGVLPEWSRQLAFAPFVAVATLLLMRRALGDQRGPPLLVPPVTDSLLPIIGVVAALALVSSLVTMAGDMVFSVLGRSISAGGPDGAARALGRASSWAVYLAEGVLTASANVLAYAAIAAILTRAAGFAWRLLLANGWRLLALALLLGILLKTLYLAADYGYAALQTSWPTLGVPGGSLTERTAAAAATFALYVLPGIVDLALPALAAALVWRAAGGPSLARMGSARLGER